MFSMRVSPLPPPLHMFSMRLLPLLQHPSQDITPADITPKQLRAARLYNLCSLYSVGPLRKQRDVLHVWRERAERRQALSAGLAGLTSRRVARLCRASLVGWDDLVVQRDRARGQACRLSARGELRFKRAAIECWGHECVLSVHVRQRLQKWAGNRAGRAASCTLAGAVGCWKREVDGALRLERLYRSCSETVMRRARRRCFEIWAAGMAAEAHLAKRMRAIVYRLRHRVVVILFASWAAGVREARVTAGRMRRVVEMWRNQARGKCFNTWVTVTVTAKRQRQVVRRAVLRLQNRLLCAAFETLKDLRSEAKEKFATRLRAFRFFRKMELGFVGRSWGIWRGTTQESAMLARVEHKVRRSARRRRVLRVFADWVGGLAEEKSQRAAIGNGRRRVLGLLLLRSRVAEVGERRVARTMFEEWAASLLEARAAARAVRRMQVATASCQHLRSTLLSSSLFPHTHLVKRRC